MTSSAVCHPFAGVFPVVSYLHVPGKMSQPLWLMMGSCFLLNTQKLSKHPTSIWPKKAPFVFLSSAHTFLPWKWMSDSSQLKIPEDFRKARFVVAQLFMFNSHGSSVAAHKFSLSVSLFHPELDVCVCTMNGAESDAFRTIICERGAERYYDLNRDELSSSSIATATGFRGNGLLGELDSMDSSLLQKLSTSEREHLIKEMQSVEGKQSGCTAGLRVVRRGVAAVTHNRCFNGMSGAPISVCGDCIPSTNCDGVLYGRAHYRSPPESVPYEEKDFIGYIPSTSILQWLEGQPS